MRKKEAGRDVLRTVAVARRADALFKAMASDFLLREQFVTDPAQVFSEYVHGKSLPTETASAGNLLLYAFIANAGLVRWVRGYTAKHWRNPPSREQFTSDLSRAIVEFGAEDLVRALIRSSVEGENIEGLRESFPLFDLLTMAFAGRDVGLTPFTDTGVTQGGPIVTFQATEPETAETAWTTNTPVTRLGTFGTETRITDSTFLVITAATFATEIVTDLVAAGTTAGTQTGGTTAGTQTGGTEAGTQTGGTEAGTQTGGTEAGTDTGGTEAGTDTGGTEAGTETGRIGLGDFGDNHWAVTLLALGQYARQLRGRGVLSNPFGNRPPSGPF